MRDDVRSLILKTLVPGYIFIMAILISTPASLGSLAVHNSDFIARFNVAASLPSRACYGFLSLCIFLNNIPSWN